MGDGDQWPVVKDTVYRVMKDWEDLKVERAVHAEMKIHIPRSRQNPKIFRINDAEVVRD